MESGVHSWGPWGAPSIFPFGTRVWRWPFKADQGLALRKKKLPDFCCLLTCLALGEKGGVTPAPNRGIGRAGGASSIDCSNLIPRGRRRHRCASAAKGGSCPHLRVGPGRVEAGAWVGSCGLLSGPSIFNELLRLLQPAGCRKAGPVGGGQTSQPCLELWPPYASGHERAVLEPRSPLAGQGSPCSWY